MLYCAFKILIRVDLMIGVLTTHTHTQKDIRKLVDEVMDMFITLW